MDDLAQAEDPVRQDMAVRQAEAIRPNTQEGTPAWEPPFRPDRKAYSVQAVPRSIRADGFPGILTAMAAEPI